MEKEYIFWFCALAGSGVFLIQSILNFSGLGAEDVDDATSQDFKWLSKQAVTGFLMMFGWIGLAMLYEGGFSFPISTLIAALAGIGSALIVGYLLRLTSLLRSTGTVFDIRDAIGKEASVYQRIPLNGKGKVTISLHEISYELDAVSRESEEIDSFQPVQIIEVSDDNTVVVAPLHAVKE